MEDKISQREKPSGDSTLPPQQVSLQEAALEYLARGWSVIPLAGKLPTLSWKEFQSRLPRRDEVTHWFDGSEQPTGIGIVTGNLSGLLVVDCDTGDAVAYWKANYPASPVSVLTGRGGLHIYYRMPPEAELRNRAGILGKAIDIRGEGGYVVAPPSLHASGKRYAWLAADFESSLPGFDAKWLMPEQQEKNLPRTTSSVKIRKAVAYIAKIEAVAGEGGHNATFRAACKLRDAGILAEEALRLLSGWNETNASPPWSAPELEHKIRSAYSLDR